MGILRDIKNKFMNNHPTHDEILDGYRYDWVSVLKNPNPSIFFKEYPTKDTDWDSIYRDQRGFVGEYQVVSTFLELGIMRLDSWMSREIRKGKDDSEFTYEQMVYMIQNQPNLHAIIKTNLLENLNNIWVGI